MSHADDMRLFGLNPEELTVEEVKERFTELAMKHHPDRGGDAEMLQKVVEARDRLLVKAGEPKKCLACKGTRRRSVTRGFHTITEICGVCRGSGVQRT